MSDALSIFFNRMHRNHFVENIAAVKVSNRLERGYLSNVRAFVSRYLIDSSPFIYIIRNCYLPMIIRV